MLSQHIQLSKPKSPVFLSTPRQFTSRPFSPQNLHHSTSQEHRDNEVFQQQKFEAFGLQLKKEQGKITPAETERLGLLQAKMESFWTQRMEVGARQPSLLERYKDQATKVSTPDIEAKESKDSHSPVSGTISQKAWKTPIAKPDFGMQNDSVSSLQSAPSTGFDTSVKPENGLIQRKPLPTTDIKPGKKKRQIFSLGLIKKATKFAKIKEAINDYNELFTDPEITRDKNFLEERNKLLDKLDLFISEWEKDKTKTTKEKDLNEASFDNDDIKQLKDRRKDERKYNYLLDLRQAIQDERGRLYLDTPDPSKIKKDDDYFDYKMQYRYFSRLPLFSEEGPKVDDVIQGNLGDCWLMAALASLAKTKPSFIKEKLIKQAPDDPSRVVVRLHPQGEPKDIITDKQVVVENKNHEESFYAGTKSCLWVALVEKAYAASMGGSYHKLSGGQIETAFLTLTGTKNLSTEQKTGEKLDDRKTRKEVEQELSKTIETTLDTEKGQKDLFTRIKDALTYGYPINMGTKKNIGEPTGKGHSSGEPMVAGMLGGHGYTIIDTSESDGECWVTVRNPWGKYSRTYDNDGNPMEDKSGKDGISKLMLSDLCKLVDIVTVAGKKIYNA